MAIQKNLQKSEADFRVSTALSHQKRALEMLEKYTYICTNFLLPYELKGDFFFDSIENWLMDYDIDAPRDEKTIKESIVQSVVETPVFFPLRNEPKFKRIVEKLKAQI